VQCRAAFTAAGTALFAFIHILTITFSSLCCWLLKIFVGNICY